MEFRIADSTIRVNVSDRDAALAAIEARLRAGRGFALATLNLDHLVKLREDARFRAAYGVHDFVSADGRPVQWLGRLAGRPVPLVTGSDLVRPLLAVAARANAPVGLVGGCEATMVLAAERLRAEIPGLDVRLCLAPSMGFDPEGEEARAVLDRLEGAGVRLALLALGAPRQERLAALGRARWPGMGFVSIGAGLDFVAGAQRRAPLWMRRAALEWLWRLGGQPGRLAGRYLRCALILPGEALRAARLRGEARRP